MTSPEARARRHPFDALKARYLVAVLIVASYWQPGIGFLYSRASNAELPAYWAGLLPHYYALALEALFLAGAAYVTRFEASAVLGRPLRLPDMRLIAVAVALVYCFGTVLLYVTVYPLSLILPEFVDWWLRWLYRPLVLTDGAGNLPIAANVASLLAVCLIGPVMEELVFRGYLLNRWARKWGLWRAVMLSSMVFALMHPSPLSAFVAGVLFALVYLRTQSLWAAIVVHGLSNLAIWLNDLHGVLTDGDAYYDVRAADAGEWLLMSITALVVAVLLIDRILRKKGALGPFALPPMPKRSRSALPYVNAAAWFMTLWRRVRDR